MGRWFKLKNVNCEASGSEFEVEDDASEEEIAQAAFDCAAERLDYGWDEIKKDTK